MTENNAPAIAPTTTSNVPLSSNETAAIVETARVALQEMDDVCASLVTTMHEIKESATEARKKRESVAFAASQGNPHAKEALANYTAEQVNAETEASNLALAIVDADARREEAERVLYVALADHVHAQAHEVAAEILAQSAEIDTLVQGCLKLIAHREELYENLRATGTHTPGPDDTRMNEWTLGLAFAAGVQAEYGTFDEQQRIFPSLIRWRSYTKTLQQQDAGWLSRISRPNPETMRQKKGPGLHPARERTSATVRSQYRNESGGMVFREDFNVERIDSGAPGATPVYEYEGPVTGGRVRRYGDASLTEGGVGKRLSPVPKAAVAKESTAESKEPGGSQEE